MILVISTKTSVISLIIEIKSEMTYTHTCRGRLHYNTTITTVSAYTRARPGFTGPGPAGPNVRLHWPNWAADSNKDPTNFFAISDAIWLFYFSALVVVAALRDTNKTFSWFSHCINKYETRNGRLVSFSLSLFFDYSKKKNQEFKKGGKNSLDSDY
jgi:hypothetical protein